MDALGRVDDVLAKPYRRLLTPDESGGYVASVSEFPGCVAHGRTPNQALARLEQAARGWIDAALSTGYPIPEPTNYDEYSGKVALRISRRLHKMAAERAAVEGTSINQLLSNAIAHFLGQADGLENATRQVRVACDELLHASHNTVVMKLQFRRPDVEPQSPEWLRYNKDFQLYTTTNSLVELTNV